MNAPTSSYQSNCRVNCRDASSTTKTAKHDPSNNERLMKYLALLEAQESVAFEHMISPQQRKNQHSPSKNTTSLMLTPAAKDTKGDLDSSIHKLLKSRRKDLRKAVHLISPSKKSSKQRQPGAAFATPIEDGEKGKQQQQPLQQSAPSRRSTIIQAAAKTNAPKASAAAVAKLPRARLFPAQEQTDNPAGDDTTDDWTCEICRHAPSQSHHTMLTRLPCGHVFHNTCAVLWLGQSCACPTCGYEMEANDAAYEVQRRERIKNRATSATCCCPCGTTATHGCLFAHSPGVVAMPCAGSSSCTPEQPVGDDSEASFEEDSEASL